MEVANFIIPQRGLPRLTRYVPGKPIEEVHEEYGITDIVKLASNENPIGPSPLTVSAIVRYSFLESRAASMICLAVAFSIIKKSLGVFA